jgi:hypothetical protein
MSPTARLSGGALRGVARAARLPLVGDPVRAALLASFGVGALRGAPLRGVAPFAARREAEDAAATTEHDRAS